MKPKRTDKVPHPSRAGRLVADGSSSDYLARVEECLRRRLQDHEASSVESLVALGRDLRQGDDRAPLADVRHTLLTIARLPDESLAGSLENCDEQTLAAISAAMKESATVQEAAAKACDRLAPGSPGARAKWYQRELAKRIHELWNELTGERGKVWCSETRVSPAAEFARIVLSSVEGREMDLRKVERLMKEAARGEFLPCDLPAMDA